MHLTARTFGIAKSSMSTGLFSEFLHYKRLLHLALHFGFISVSLDNFFFLFLDFLQPKTFNFLGCSAFILFSEFSQHKILNFFVLLIHLQLFVPSSSECCWSVYYLNWQTSSNALLGFWYDSFVTLLFFYVAYLLCIYDIGEIDLSTINI